MEKTKRKIKVEKQFVEEEVTVVTLSKDELQTAMSKAIAKVVREVEDPMIILTSVLVTAELIEYLFHNDDEKED